MSDNLDQVIAECKKVDSGIARFMQSIFEDTKRRYESKEQRSETMETYSTLEMMHAAKEQPGKVFKSIDHTIAMTYHISPESKDYWELIGMTGERHLIVDGSWEESKPLIKQGDWVHVHNIVHDNYAQVISISSSCQLELHFLNTDVGYFGNAGSFFPEDVKVVKDERALMFLNAGRKPDDWKNGDIATDGVSLFTIGYDWHENSAREQQFMPVCFAESRVDRGDTP